MKGEIAICANPACASEFVKKKINHQACSNKCRAAYHRIINPRSDNYYSNIPRRAVQNTASIPNTRNVFARRAATSVFNGAVSPAIMNVIGKGSFAKNAISSVVSGAVMPMIREQITSGVKVRFSPVDEEINYWTNQKKYWEGERDKIVKGVFPVRTVAGAVIGGLLGFLASRQFAPEEKMQGVALGGTVGGAIGSFFQGQANEQMQINADAVINNADAKIHEADTKLVELRARKFEVKRLVESNVLEQGNDGYYSVTEQYVNTIMSAEQYRGLTIPKIEFKGAYRLLLNDARKNFYKIVTGLPEQGKTSYCIRFATYFAQNHGKVLYLPAEQSGQNLDFQKVLNQNNGKGFRIDPNVNSYSFDELLQRTKGFDLVILDSVNYMKLSDKQINRINHDCAIMAVMQSTKDGGFKGGQEFFHDCDKFVTVDKFTVFASKSRGTDPSEEREALGIDKL